MKNIKDIIKQAIDIHMHIGPEAIPRKYIAGQLVQAEQGKIGGFVLKNHFYPTTPFIQEVISKEGLKLIGSVVLNNSVGGLNPETIYALRILTDDPIMVWFPTINAENFLRQTKYEIAPEWVNKNNFTARKTKDIEPVMVTKNNKLTQQAIKVLRTIKQCNAALATGHISWQESVLLVEKALKLGIKNIVVTHPIYQRIAMPVEIQKKLAAKGCFIEQSYSMYSIDKISIKKMAKQIKAVGVESVILSSDVGQAFSPAPSTALYNFATLLQQEGISQEALFTMLVANPKKLLSIT